MIQKYLLFSVFKNFIKLKKGLISRDDEENLQTNSLHCFVHPLVYFNFNKFKYANSMSFISHFNAFCIIQKYFCHFLKEGRDLISWGNQFCRTAELFGPPFCISI